MDNRFLDTSTISAESSLSLLRRAQQGDGVAVEALMARYLPRLQRWASGRIPASARGLLDTNDVVQDALLGTLQRLKHFTPRHDGALMAYLRVAVANRIRMELRRRQPGVTAEGDLEALASGDPSPLELAAGSAAFARYEQALAALDEDDRAAIVARFEMGYSYDALARARSAVERRRTQGGGTRGQAARGAHGCRRPHDDDRPLKRRPASPCPNLNTSSAR